MGEINRNTTTLTQHHTMRNPEKSNNYTLAFTVSPRPQDSYVSNTNQMTNANGRKSDSELLLEFFDDFKI